jgi:hypothetical protein
VRFYKESSIAFWRNAGTTMVAVQMVLLRSTIDVDGELYEQYGGKGLPAVSVAVD